MLQLTLVGTLRELFLFLALLFYWWAFAEVHSVFISFSSPVLVKYCVRIGTSAKEGCNVVLQLSEPVCRISVCERPCNVFFPVEERDQLCKRVDLGENAAVGVLRIWRYHGCFESRQCEGQGVAPRLKHLTWSHIKWGVRNETCLLCNRTFFTGSLTSFGNKSGKEKWCSCYVKAFTSLQCAVWAVTGGKPDLNSRVISAFPRQLWAHCMLTPQLHIYFPKYTFGIIHVPS